MQTPILNGYPVIKMETTEDFLRNEDGTISFIYVVMCWRPAHECHKYVVATWCNLDPDCWSQGNYVATWKEADEAFDRRLGNHSK